MLKLFLGLCRSQCRSDGKSGEDTVKNKFAAIVLAVSGLMAVSVPLFAHHGQAAFETDPAKRVTLKGTVTEWYWANPHCFLKLDVKDEGGQVVHWVAEVSNPSDMTDRGWSKQSFKPGDQVTVTLRPVKRGDPAGSIVQVVLPNGQTLSSQLPPPAK
jgi:hypothetical protein